MEQGAEEEINRLKETLAVTSHEMKQIKDDYVDHSDKLQYAEQLLEKAKADFRDKNSRIKAIEAHLDESRNEISRLTRQLYYFKEERESFKEELKHTYELRYEPSRTGRAPTSPSPSKRGHLFLEPSSRHKPPSWCSRMSTNNEHSAVARFGAESLRQTKDGRRKERQNPSSS